MQFRAELFEEITPMRETDFSTKQREVRDYAFQFKTLEKYAVLLANYNYSDEDCDRFMDLFREIKKNKRANDVQKYKRSKQRWTTH